MKIEWKTHTTYKFTKTITFKNGKTKIIEYLIRLHCDGHIYIISDYKKRRYCPHYYKKSLAYRIYPLEICFLCERKIDKNDLWVIHIPNGHNNFVHQKCREFILMNIRNISQLNETTLKHIKYFYHVYFDKNPRFNMDDYLKIKKLLRRINK